MEGYQWVAYELSEKEKSYYLHFDSPLDVSNHLNQ
jgi:hypothetical protein